MHPCYVGSWLSPPCVLGIALLCSGPGSLALALGQEALQVFGVAVFDVKSYVF